MKIHVHEWGLLDVLVTINSTTILKSVSHKIHILTNFFVAGFKNIRDSALPLARELSSFASSKQKITKKNIQKLNFKIFFKNEKSSKYHEVLN
jgi:hypothetical protein